MTDTPPPSLDELRRQIDATDDALHDLMMRRMALAAEVKAAKAGAPGPVWRPAREARILRRLIDRHDLSFMPAALVSIWRILICESIAAQRPLAVATLDSTFAAAVQHFPTCEFVPANRPEEALQAAAEDADALAVLPGPVDNTWPALPKILAARRHAPDLNLLAMLPFLAAETDPENAEFGPEDALVFGRAAPEDSGEDITMIVSFWTPDGELPRNPRKHPKPPPGELERGERIDAAPYAYCDGATAFLIRGLVGANDPRLANFQAPIILGAYAAPIRLDLGAEAALTDDVPNRQ